MKERKDAEEIWNYKIFWLWSKKKDIVKQMKGQLFNWKIE